MHLRVVERKGREKGRVSNITMHSQVYVREQRTSLVLLMEVIPVSNSASYWLGVIIYALGSDKDIRAGIMAASTYI